MKYSNSKLFILEWMRMKRSIKKLLEKCHGYFMILRNLLNIKFILSLKSKYQVYNIILFI